MEKEIEEKKRYSNKEELFNMISHIVGALLGVVILIMCLIRTSQDNNTLGIVGSIIYGLSVIICYSCSAYYHGLRQKTPKKIFRVLDHCSIYLLIAGTYTMVTLSGMVPVVPLYGWLIFGLVWGLAILGIILSAISIERFKIISMILNILIGWMAVFFCFAVIEAITLTGFLLILVGGIAYTLGAILYGIGKRKPYFHFVFHVLCVAGTLVQFIAVLLFCI